MAQIYYYLTSDVLEAIQNRSLFHEDGGEKDFDRRSISENDLDTVKGLLEDTASLVFEKIHRRGRGYEGVYVFDDAITIDEEELEGPYIAYTLVFPDNFDTNLVKRIDRAIRRCLIDVTFSEWLDLKGFVVEKAIYKANKSLTDLRKLINHRTTLSKTYRGPY